MIDLMRAVAAAFAASFALTASAAAAGLSVYVSYADWCGPCQVLMPKLHSAVAQFPPQDIEMVVLDFTDMSTENLDRQFERAGPFSPQDFMENGRYLKTGFAYLVANGSFEGQISAGMAAEDIAARFRAALDR